MFEFFVGLLVGFTAGGAFIAFVYKKLLDSEKTTKEKLVGEFKAAASDTLHQTAEQFLSTAIKDLRQVQTEAGQGMASDKKDIERFVSDMKTRLEETQKALRAAEEERLKMYGNLEKSLTQVFDAEQSIRTEATALKNVLTSNSGVRGHLGEMVLERMLEENGLVKGIGYDTQVALTDAESNDFRPDFVVHLPGGKRLVIDSKEMSGEFVLAQESADETARKDHYQKLVQNIRNNFNRLSRKEYQAQIDPEIPFVVMFVSSEAAIRAAFATEPALYREALDKKVFLASPMTLIPLIQLIKYGWQQYRLANNARQLGEIVEELGNRLFTFVSHLKNMKEGIQKTGDAWDNAVRSWETRVAPQIQKAKDAGGKLKETDSLPAVAFKPRSLEEPAKKS